MIVGGNDNNNGDGAGGTAAPNLSSGTGSTPLTGGANGNNGGPLAGRVTGLSYGNFLSNGNLFGVTTGGEFIEINPNSGTVTRRLNVAGALGGNINFQGLTLGPQNVEGGAYANTLFAVTNTGALYAFDTTKMSAVSNGNDPAQVLGVMRNIFAGSSYSAQASGISASAVGIAFSPLDFNLWHPTMKRATDAGHGIENAPDGSRDPADVNLNIANRTTTQAAGGASLHFGFEQWLETHNADSASYLTYNANANAQLGIRTTVQHQDLSSNAAIVGTYNFPGGVAAAHSFPASFRWRHRPQTTGRRCISITSSTPKTMLDRTALAM